MQGKTIFIVGGGGHIGKAIGREFVKNGGNVTFFSRTQSKLEDAVRGLHVEQAVDHTHIFAGDALKPEDLERALTETKARFGGVDAVVLSAGGWTLNSRKSSDADSLNAAEDHFRDFFLIPFISGRVALKFFEEQGHGMLLNMSSHAALNPKLEGNDTYGPMKAAAHLLMTRWRWEEMEKGSGILIGNLTPMIVNTPDTASVLPTPEMKAKAVQPRDIGRWVVDHIDDKSLQESTPFNCDVVV